jgi:hypothetical protein
VTKNHALRVTVFSKQVLNVSDALGKRLDRENDVFAQQRRRGRTDRPDRGNDPFSQFPQRSLQNWIFGELPLMEQFYLGKDPRRG